MKNKNTSIEQMARDILERMEVPNAQEYSAGDLVELANIINIIAELSTYPSKTRLEGLCEEANKILPPYPDLWTATAIRDEHPYNDKIIGWQLRKNEEIIDCGPYLDPLCRKYGIDQDAENFTVI